MMNVGPMACSAALSQGHSGDRGVARAGLSGGSWIQSRSLQDTTGPVVGMEARTAMPLRRGSHA